MFVLHRKISNPRQSIHTLIGANTTINGSVDCNGTLRVEGKIQGNVNITGDVLVGKNAVVLGNIYAQNIELNGLVEGNIYAEGMLRISSTAKLIGDVDVESFVSDQGAVFEGKCVMKNPLPLKNEPTSVLIDPTPTLVCDETKDNCVTDTYTSKSYRKSSLLNGNENDKKQ